jgi:hypothetical protein
VRIPLSSEDAAERAQFLRLFIHLLPFALLLLLAGEGLAYARGMIGGWVLLLLVLLNVPLIFGFSVLVFWMMDRSATALSKMVYAGGNLPPDPEHSSIEALAARGFYTEAAEAYRGHLVAVPTDHAARLKLADLYRSQLNEPAAAERLYLEIRGGNPSPKEDRLAANLLIELYRATGRHDRLIVELARFAAQWKGTRAGTDAAKALKEMKQAMKEE